MTPNDYQQLAARTANATLSSQLRLAVAGLGLAGEAGEVADLIKKVVGHGHRVDTTKLADELGDILWYIAEACTIIGVDMEAVMAQNVAKLQLRYPAGFSTERSVNRAQ